MRPGPSVRPATKKSAGAGPVGRSTGRCRHQRRDSDGKQGDEVTHRRSRAAGSQECRSLRGRRGRWRRPSPRRRARRSYRAFASPARVPVASAKIASPSPDVCAGTMARAKPSCAICATFVACAFVRTALVATTPMVVFSSGAGVRRKSARRRQRADVGEALAVRRCACRRRRGRSRIDDVAAALTATSAATTSPSGSAIAALPRPPFIARCGPPSCRPSRRRRRRRCLPPTGRSLAALRRRSRSRRPDGSSRRRRRDRKGSRPARSGRPRRRTRSRRRAPRGAHHAAGGVEAERAAAREHDRVHALDGRGRIEQIGLARARRAAAHVDAGDRALLGQDHGAAGRALPSACDGRPSALDGGQALRRAGGGCPSTTVERADAGRRSGPSQRDAIMAPPPARAAAIVVAPAHVCSTTSASMSRKRGWSLTAWARAIGRPISRHTAAASTSRS